MVTLQFLDNVSSVGFPYIKYFPQKSGVLAKQVDATKRVDDSLKKVSWFS